ncbi:MULTISPECIES: hypothetical protein [Fulvivirga]|uniref:Uncharacterized protein n=1 Tax=Fulvivirga lutea TaxID=2810512 RepID=A0A974WF69_9BACT|nr:hypothetical protein [Fulvivirga lutea]QSE95962.1 hypothetical protein JR347_10045 [Fulvivirga lutea]
MSNKTRSVLKLVAIIIVVLCVLMNLSIVIIPVLAPHAFWMVVIAFGLLFIAGK